MHFSSIIGTFVRWVGAGQQPPRKLIGIDSLDQCLADLGERHAVKGVACNEFAPHQPVEEGTGLW